MKNSESEDMEISVIPDYAVTESESEILHKLLKDPKLNIMDRYYFSVLGKLSLYLSSGYKEIEIQGEFGLSNQQYISFKSKVPKDVWESLLASSKKWIGRKRAELLSRRSSSDLTIVQTLDPEWNPKLNIGMTHDINVHDTTEEEDEELKQFLG